MTINDYVLLSKQNDELAIEHLIRQFRKSMNKIKGSYKYVPEEEKETLCMIGLMKAIRKFNIDDKRCIFHTYLHVVINNEFKMYIKSSKTQKNSIKVISFSDLAKLTCIKYETDLYQLAGDSLEDEILGYTDLSICINNELDKIEDINIKNALYDVIYKEYKMTEASEKHNIKYRRLKKAFYECRDKIKETYRGNNYGYIQ